MRSTKRRRHGELARGLSFGTTWGLSRPLAPTKGVSASAYAPYAAPSGWRWDFVTEIGARVTERLSPAVTLVRA